MSSTVLAVGGGAVVLGAWVTRVALAFDRGMYDPDTLTYHLPMAARFAQTGWTTRLHHIAPDGPTTFQVGNLELLHGFGLVVFGHDVASPLVNLGWLGLGALAAWCIGRPWGLGPQAVLALLVVAATSLMSSTQGGSAMTDFAAIALVLAAIALLTAARGPAAFAVAGLAAGAALSTKLTVLAMVGVVTLGLLVERGSARSSKAAFVGALAMTGATWFVRNLVRVGNPLPTLHLGVGPLRLPAPDIMLIDRYGYAVADYVASSEVWRSSFLPGLRIAFGRAWPLVVAAAVGGGILALRAEWRWKVIGASVLVGYASYTVTPTTALGERGEPVLFIANLRYLTPALAVGLVLLPLALREAPAMLRSLAAGALAALLAITLLPTGHEPPWHSARSAAGIVAAGTLVIVVAAWWAVRSRSAVWLRGAAAVSFFVTALVVGFGGWSLQSHYLAVRYRSGGQPQGAAFAWAQDISGARIGFAGFFQQYPLYGRDVSNHVQYVGRGTVHHGFTTISGCRAWREAVNRGRYDYVVTAPAFVDDSEMPREAAWTSGRGGATEIVSFELDRIFRVDGPLDPSACP